MYATVLSFLAMEHFMNTQEKAMKGGKRDIQIKCKVSRKSGRGLKTDINK